MPAEGREMQLSEKMRDVLYLLFLIGEGSRRSAAGAVEGAVKLQKLVFLAREEGVPFGYRFDSQFRGPFSRELARDLGLLEDLGFIEVIPDRGFSAAGRPLEKRLYRLTRQGEHLLSEHMSELDKAHLSRIRDVVARYADVPIGEIVEEALRRWLPPVALL